MGFLDLFKRKKEKIEEIVPIDYEKIGDFIGSKEEKFSDRKQEIFNEFKEKISKLKNKIENSLEGIDQVDIASLSQNGRVESMAQGNIKNLKIYLNDLIYGLNKIDSIDNAIQKINEEINKFENNSAITMKKLNFVIPSHSKNIKKSIANFLKEFEMTLKMNENFLNEIDSINKLKIKIRELKELNEKKEEKEKEKDFLKGEIKKLKERKEVEKKELDSFKHSKEFLENQENKIKKERKEKELEKKIINFGQDIDFKKMIKFYHKFPNQLKEVKDYQDDLVLKIKIEGTEKIKGFLQETGNYTSPIQKKLEEIEKIRREEKNIQIANISCSRYEERINNTQKEIEIEEKKLSNNEKELIELDNLLKKIKEELMSLGKKISIEIKF